MSSIEGCICNPKPNPNPNPISKLNPKLVRSNDIDNIYNILIIFIMILIIYGIGAFHEIKLRTRFSRNNWLQ